MNNCLVTLRMGRAAGGMSGMEARLFSSGPFDAMVDVHFGLDMSGALL